MITVGSPVCRPHIATDEVNSARDALPDPVIIVAAEKLQVLFDYLDRGIPHFILGDARIDSHVIKRVVEAVQVFVEFEDPVAEGACHVKHGVAVLEAAIPEWHDGLAFRHDLAVEVRHTFVLTGRRHFVEPFD